MKITVMMETVILDVGSSSNTVPANLDKTWSFDRFSRDLDKKQNEQNIKYYKIKEK